MSHILVPLRPAATAKVEGEHAPRPVAVSREMNGEILEIAGAARQAGDADDRKPGRDRVAELGDMKAEPVAAEEVKSRRPSFGPLARDLDKPGAIPSHRCVRRQSTSYSLCVS